MKKKGYDGRVGRFQYRAGETAGCFNLFLDGKFKVAVTKTVLDFLQKWEKKGVSFTMKDINDLKRAELAELHRLWDKATVGYKVATYCDFGEKGRKTLLSRHMTFATAMRQYAVIWDIYHRIHHWRVWQEVAK